MTMVFAIIEINKNDTILPNITLGYDIYDSCFAIPKVTQHGLLFLENVIDLVSKTEEICLPKVVIGPYASKLTKLLSTTFGLFHFPQVMMQSSYSA